MSEKNLGKGAGKLKYVTRRNTIGKNNHNCASMPICISKKKNYIREQSTEASSPTFVFHNVLSGQWHSLPLVKGQKQKENENKQIPNSNHFYYWL